LETVGATSVSLIDAVIDGRAVVALIVEAPPMPLSIAPVVHRSW
jgi:hypothetical protein